MRPVSVRTIVGIVLMGHYLSAFTVLGLPLFLPLFLSSLITAVPAWMYGVFYIIPTLLTAVFTPWWGRMADRYGYRLSLQRAYGGLAIGFFLAGVSQSIGLFLLALFIQGICGGAMGASNAYLGSFLDRAQLRVALNWTQFSARLAMVTAPWVIGLVMDYKPGLYIYSLLSLFPLSAFFLSFLLPITDKKPESNASITGKNGLMPLDAESMPPIKLPLLLGLQAVYSFSMVVTFPYFVLYAHKLGLKSNGVIGFFYGFPHLVYLMGMPALKKYRPPNALFNGLFLFAVSVLFQGYSPTIGSLVLFRLLMGVGIILTYCGLHDVLSHWAKAANSGAIFGQFDSAGKFSGAFAGLAAGFLVQNGNVFSPFYVAAVASFAAAFFILPYMKAVEGSA
ncbi:MFS transporter [Entomobacter blattae]|uniref:Multidrug resistance protein MdtG n=1 Tax=Entomobacter blattae TaxID=2762277 RepID=A0A7H1NTX9_9PROT|nr:MFS transporter [Entomobacter blattae]QNT79239.1 Multidrug resistance protein MdtG [Entomobacter blattae]